MIADGVFPIVIIIHYKVKYVSAGLPLQIGCFSEFRLLRVVLSHIITRFRLAGWLLCSFFSGYVSK